MYEVFFNLKEKPFPLSPDPRYIYLTPQHNEALAKCEYSISQKMGISMIFDIDDFWLSRILIVKVLCHFSLKLEESIDEESVINLVFQQLYPRI